MSSPQSRGGAAVETPTTDLKLEVVVLPVADVERSKEFYTALGWRLDGDFVAGGGFRLVQLTPPGSACSIQFGKGISTARPGSGAMMYLVVSDIEAARAALRECGAAVGEVFHREGPGAPPVNGRDPEGRSYSSFALFEDPDGNAWLLQEITERLPGRIDSSETTYSSAAALASAMRRASTAHEAHEKRLGHRDEEWPEWYADYMVSEQAGSRPPR